MIMVSFPQHGVRTVRLTMIDTGAPAGLKNVDARPVGSEASFREMIHVILITTLP